MRSMSALLEDLTNTARPDLPYVEPRYSRKTKRVIVAVRDVNFSVPVMRLDAAIDIATALADGTGPLQSLLDGLLHARQKYGHIIDGKKKARGKQAGWEGILYTLKYAAAWAYVVVQDQIKKPAAERLSTVRAAEQELKKRVPSWGQLSRFEKCVFLTAFLVEKAYGIERRKEGLINRLQALESFEPRNWYRDYIKPRLLDVHRRVNKSPPAIVPNAYLRKIFSNETFNRH